MKSVAATQSDMKDKDAPYHAHIYYVQEQRAQAEGLRLHLGEMKASGEISRLLYVGQLRDRKVGPHPIPQFEIHFTKEVLPNILGLLEASGLTSLVHPLTDDDLADHTRLAHWIGQPLELDLTTLDPPGVNQGIARFSKTDF
jgi:aromatic ring-cleaving dioxygenase